MAFDLKEAIRFMEEYGLYDVLIPFLLVFTIIFATLDKIKIFGKESRRYNALIALSIALMFIAATNLVEALNKYLPIIGLVLAAFLGLMLMLGMFGVKEGGPGQKFFWIIAGGVALAIGLTYLPRMGGILGNLFEPLKEYSTIIIVLAILIGLIIWLTRGEKETKPISRD
ncbi:MAG: hypothetical protein ISS23_00695 [Nanoarchaeota archaeon]|nr:hypothetical protein [Nanoarchaeota archaeon]